MLSKLAYADEVQGVSGAQNLSVQQYSMVRAPERRSDSLAEVEFRKHSIVIGKDTRHSGPMLEAALIAGLHSIGVDVILVGILPTPAIALLTRDLHADAGIVISASHNPAADNGLKIFRSDGYKLNDILEKRLEELILTPEIDGIRPTGSDVGSTTFFSEALERYVAACKESVPTLSLKGLKIAVDCAHGASFLSTPKILRELGAEVHLFHATPNGININEACGSMHPEEISRLTRETGAHLGLAHDGDADRLVLCDEQGNIVDGDEILAITALDALKRGTLNKNTLVTTVMSNFGLDECLEEAGGKVVRTAVGDRYVVEAMLEGGFNIGGEQSGHMIFRDYSTTGDGIVAALQILRVMAETGQPLSKLRQCLKKYPQVQCNLRVKIKPPLESLTSIAPLLKKAEQELQGKGRILLRYSGTEPLLRLLIEGRDETVITQLCEQITKALIAILCAEC
ncbi:MAG: phosphoglucosamine mutase [Verrucomicrobia bacterium RIFCSPHIGHO2_12_FULL_41_10]|nr:MAG: phosphoglucosamine mutase [Verrucomicrobia bacterium RIFCSPHIGHO2_12_FULL_41_10]